MNEALNITDGDLKNRLKGDVRTTLVHVYHRLSNTIHETPYRADNISIPKNLDSDWIVLFRLMIKMKGSGPDQDEGFWT